MRTVAYLLSLLLVFSIPWEDAVVLGQMGTMTRMIGLLAATAWIASALITGKIRRPQPFHVVVYLFVLWNIASVFWSIAVDETMDSIKTYLQLAVLTWILWDLYRTRQALGAALQAYILGAYVTIGSTIFSYLAGQEIGVASGRYAGSSLNACDLALILCLGIPIAWHLATTGDGGFGSSILKLVNYAYIPASLFAIVLTGSRLAIFSLLPALVFILGTGNQLRPSLRLVIFTALVGIGWAAQRHLPQSSWDRLATAGDSIAAADLGGRVILWRASMTAFVEHPIVGLGAGALHAASALGTLAHNTFLSVLAELGIIGFILFAAILGVTIQQATRQPKGDVSLWLTVLATWAIGVCTLTWEFRKPTWLFLALVTVGAGLSVRNRWSASWWESSVQSPVAVDHPAAQHADSNQGADVGEMRIAVRPARQGRNG